MTTSVEAQQSTNSPRGLRRLLASTGVSMVGQGAVSAAVPLLATTLTNDPFWVSVVAASTYAAWFVVGLPAGALVDRWPRRQVMVAADLIRVVLLAALVAGVALDLLSVGALAVIVFLIACAGCFFDPAAQAGIPILAGRDPATLARANGRFWTLDILGRSLLGPPLGSALFAVAVMLPLGLNVLTFLASALLLVGIRGLGAPASEHPAEPVLQAVKTGGVYLIKHAQLRMLTLGMGTYNLGYNIAFATFVLFATEHLGLKPGAFGVLLAMLAVGGLVGGWLGPRLHVRLSVMATYAICLVVQSAGWLLMLATPSVWLTGTLLVAVGLVSTVVSVVGGTARQSLTPDHLLGRITAGTRVVGIGSAALGSLIGGGVAQAGDLTTPLVVAGAFLLVGAAFFAVAALRRPS
ncbi:MFS transporter [Nocardioides sp. NBC_00850]|uniref:MFS transporter n=1 Tax=Nocardioides sp. NBC_00850 TaxID=2976001 RepID=UPI00386777DC|nr:MFS transporter [Nocardioides sp. NBC_00850]